jgi:hypothetical protein
MSPILIVVLVLAVLFVVLLMVFSRLYVYVEKLKKTALASLPDNVTLVKGPLAVNYRGHQSIAVPLKGSGVLLLTDRDLRFVRLAPRKEFVIPFEQMQRVTEQRTFKGSAKGTHPVVVVHFQDGALQDAIGFILPNSDRQAWIDAITHAAHVPYAKQ